MPILPERNETSALVGTAMMKMHIF